MKPERIARVAALAVAVCLTSLPACAQVTTSKPVTVKMKSVKPRNPVMATFQGEVLHMDAQAIIVRDRKNSAIVRTFNYTPELSKKLKSLIDRGGYPYGVHVVVKYARGGSVAQSITGKTSKPH